MIDEPTKELVREYLRRQDSVNAMVNASNEGRPALEIIADGVYEIIGDELHENTVKQWVGKEVKPVMEAAGYRLVDDTYYSRKARGQRFFKTGALYVPR